MAAACFDIGLWFFRATFSLTAFSPN
jgi:hypothetical protein